MPKIVDHNQIREDILSGSFELFARTGFSPLTMREIAQQLGLSTGTLYHYFSSKEEIFRQMLELLSRRDVLQAVSQISIERRPEEKLAAVFQFVSLKESYFQNLIFIILDFYRNENLADHRSIVVETASYYRDAINEHMGFKDPVAGNLLFSIVLGLILQRLMDPENAQFAQQAALAGRILETMGEQQ